MTDGNLPKMKTATRRSRFEHHVGLWLEQKGIVYEYETLKLPYYVKEHSASCTGCGGKDIRKHGNYIPDYFLVDLGIILEAKGRWDAQDRKKLKAIKEQHPDIDLRMVFMYDNWITKNKKKRYSTVCEQLNIPFCVGVHNLNELLSKELNVRKDNESES